MAVDARSTIWNVLYNYAGLVFATAIGLVLTPVLAHQLGRTDFGGYALIGSLSVYASLLDLGVGNTVMRLLASHAEDDDKSAVTEIFSNGLALYVGLSSLLLAVGLVALPFLGPLFHLTGGRLHDFRIAYLIGVAGLAISFAAALFTGALHAFQDFRSTNIIALASSVVSSGGMLAVALLGGKLVPVVAVGTAVSVAVFTAKVAVTRLKYGLRPVRWMVQRGRMLTLLRTSVWLLISNFAVVIIFNVDNFVVGAVLGATAVAGFAVTVGASSAIQSVGSSLTVVTLSASSALRSKADDAGLQRMLLESVRMTAVVLGPISALVGAWGVQVLRTWVGPSYESSAATLSIIVLGTAVAMVESAATQVLIAVGRQRRVAAVVLPEAIANLALSIVLAKLLGIVGVALGTLIPTTVSTVFVVVPMAAAETGVPLVLVVRRLAPACLASAALYGILELPMLGVHFQNLGVLLGSSVAICAAVWAGLVLADGRERHTYLSLLRRRAQPEHAT